LDMMAGYTAVKDVLGGIRPVMAPGFEVRFETPPGRQAQVDFAHFRTVFTDAARIVDRGGLGNSDSPIGGFPA